MQVSKDQNSGYKLEFPIIRDSHVAKNQHLEIYTGNLKISELQGSGLPDYNNRGKLAIRSVSRQSNPYYSYTGNEGDCMQVILKVIGGKHDGREIPITIPEFIIGRGDNAHLRPNSDLISRKHCSIKVDEGKVVIKDMGSRNGTLINGKLIDNEHEVQPGDILRVGRLQFEMVIDVAQPSAKKPKVQDVADAVARTGDNTAKSGPLNEESITDWLSQPSESSASMADTQHFRFDETPTKLFTKSGETKSKSDSDSIDSDTTEEESKSGRHKKKKKPGKLPNKPVQVSESSKSAADDVLRKFFNRR